MSRYTRILSIDGGGIRGIIPGQVLTRLEQRLQEIDGPQARIADYFDLIAGTSTGGILTCVYLCPDPDDPGRPRFTASDAVRLYQENGAEIFNIPTLHLLRSMKGLGDEKYPAHALQAVLERYFGDLKLSQLLRPCVITAYDLEERATKFFNQVSASAAADRDFLVRDVARATSAAPTFFECARITSLSGIRHALVDGGTFANNPALCAYAEARKMPHRPTAKDMVIVSLGTGSQRRSYEYEEAKDWGAVEWVLPVIDIMMSGVSETVDYQLRQIYDAVGLPDHYLRLQVDLTEKNAEMDDTSRSNLDDLADLGRRLARDREHDLEKAIHLLRE